MMDIDSYFSTTLNWSALPKKVKLGHVIMNLAILGPFYMSLSMILGRIAMPPEQENPWIVFFNYASPLQLLFTAVFAEISVNFFLIKKSIIAWWLTILTALWIGVQDSIAAIFFWLKFPEVSPPLMALIVTPSLLVGTWLLKDYVKSES